MAIESLAGKDERLEGVYRLGAAIRRSARSAVYETEFGEGESAVPAVIRIREAGPESAEGLSQLQEDATRLEHPNLLKIYAAGSSTLNDVPVSYVVMERADESLDAVLAERALTEGETREMLVPVLDALGYLHKNGYAHSRLRPSNVLAVNDRLKLSSDSVIRANDGEAADDMGALGVLIFQVLTQRSPNGDLEEIPETLRDIVRHCLDPDRFTRWSVEKVKARLNEPAVVVREVPPPVEDETTGMPQWIFAGLAALMLIVVVAALIRSHHSAPVATSVSVATPQRAMPAPPTEAPYAAPQTTPRQPATAPDSRKASGWSVIVGAYGSREAAEKRMHELAKKWPKFEISVSESHAEKTPYLVVLGRNLSEDQAEALRKRAVQSGLPHDTYIKRAM